MPGAILTGLLVIGGAVVGLVVLIGNSKDSWSDFLGRCIGMKSNKDK